MSSVSVVVNNSFLIMKTEKFIIVIFSWSILYINLSLLQLPSLVAQMVKSLPAKQEGEGNGTPLQFSCLENPMGGGSCRLQSMGSWRVGHNWGTSLSLFTFLHWRRKWQPTPVLLPGESQGRRSLVGCRCFRVGHDWRDLAAAAAAKQETWVWSLGQENPLKKRMATHSSILAWRISWTEETGGL